MKHLIVVLLGALTSIGSVLGSAWTPNPTEGVADLKRNIVAFTESTFPNQDLGKRAVPTGWTTGSAVRVPVLQITNAYRNLHSAPPVTWNQTLANYALSKGRQCNFRSSGGPYGEILAGSLNSNNPAWLVWFLYGESRDYNYRLPVPNDPDTKHFTQLVWFNTKQIGCAWIEGCPDLYYQLWCEFSPPGNVGGFASYRANVLPEDESKPIPAQPPNII
ncbi:hypothetical protein ABW19_dt0204161 [Dactylella cylindrospora]|nr:hypothetical protein ABW19_dt0204161 [Dactylella cylindrospora]